jgi:hypothetical protein
MDERLYVYVCVCMCVEAVANVSLMKLDSTMATCTWFPKLQTPTIMFRAGACAGAEVLHMNVYTHEMDVHTDLMFIKRGTNNSSFEPVDCPCIHVVTLCGAGPPFFYDGYGPPRMGFTKSTSWVSPNQHHGPATPNIAQDGPRTAPRRPQDGL